MSNTDKQKESVSLWEMRKIETIEEFYSRKFGGIPDNIRKEIGHFNVFKLDPFVGENVKPVNNTITTFIQYLFVADSAKKVLTKKCLLMKKKSYSAMFEFCNLIIG